MLEVLELVKLEVGVVRQVLDVSVVDAKAHVVVLVHLMALQVYYHELPSQST